MSVPEPPGPIDNSRIAQVKGSGHVQLKQGEAQPCTRLLPAGRVPLLAPGSPLLPPPGFQLLPGALFPPGQAATSIQVQAQDLSRVVDVLSLCVGVSAPLFPSHALCRLTCLSFLHDPNPRK